MWDSAVGAFNGAMNVLDLPGSSVRDLLAGENPLDQWMSPLTGDHRVSGADLVSRYTGANPDSLATKVGGFGVEMLTGALAAYNVGVRSGGMTLE